MPAPTQPRDPAGPALCPALHPRPRPGAPQAECEHVCEAPSPRLFLPNPQQRSRLMPGGAHRSLEPREGWSQLRAGGGGSGKQGQRELVRTWLLAEPGRGRACSSITEPSLLLQASLIRPPGSSEGRKVLEFLILLCQAYSCLSEENGDRVIHPSKVGLGEPAPTSAMLGEVRRGGGAGRGHWPRAECGLPGSAPRPPSPHRAWRTASAMSTNSPTRRCHTRRSPSACRVEIT